MPPCAEPGAGRVPFASEIRANDVAIEYVTRVECPNLAGAGCAAMGVPERVGRWRSVVVVARAVPFVVCAGLSIWVAGRAPSGRRAPQFDWSVDLSAVARAVTKVPHMKWMVVLFLLALLAVGFRRSGTAAGLTLAVGVGWELAETTVVGHHAALVDLLPDGVTVLAVWVVIVGIRTRAWRRRVPKAKEHV